MTFIVISLLGRTERLAGASSATVLPLVGRAAALAAIVPAAAAARNIIDRVVLVRRAAAPAAASRATAGTGAVSIVERAGVARLFCFVDVMGVRTAVITAAIAVAASITVATVIAARLIGLESDLGAVATLVAIAAAVTTVLLAHVGVDARIGALLALKRWLRRALLLVGGSFCGLLLEALLVVGDALEQPTFQVRLVFGLEELNELRPLGLVVDVEGRVRLDLVLAAV
mmetsp:Transcript_2543/g.5866  ORF Transcript_2543/g.5866 Transcript_2543/m.5866 type:complete len:229 (-) Transcript_2543:583-1269(-)